MSPPPPPPPPPATQADQHARVAIMQRRAEIFGSLQDDGWVMVSESDFSTTFALYMCYTFLRSRHRSHALPRITVRFSVATPPTDPYQSTVLSEVSLTQSTPVFP